MCSTPDRAVRTRVATSSSAVLPRTFDYGFATGLMVKDIRLYLDEARSLGLPTEMADAVAQMWESTLIAEGPESDFTSVTKPIEAAAGVIVKGDSGDVPLT